MKTYAYWVSPHGTGFKVNKALMAEESLTVGIDSDKFVSIENDTPFHKIKESFENKKYVIPFVYEYNVVAPSEIYQIFWDCETEEVYNKLQNLVPVSGKIYLTGIIHKIKYVNDVPEDLWSKFLEY